MCVSKNKKNSYILYFALFLVCISCEGKDTYKSTEQTSIVKTVEVTVKKINEDLNSFGSVSYKTKHDVTALVEGTIIRLAVKEGDTVSFGQQLAFLRNVQLEIQREQSENAVESAKASLFLAETKMQEARLTVESRLLSLEQSALKMEQQELELQDALVTLTSKSQLHSIGGVTDSAFKSLQLSISAKQVDIAVFKKEREIAMLGLRDKDLHENGYEISNDSEEKKKQLIDFNTRSVAAEIAAAKAGLRNAEKSLTAVETLVDELTIRSPVVGIIGARYYENGEYVKENEKIATVMDVSAVHAVFYIQEQDIRYFTVGSPLVVELPSLELKRETNILEISPIADPKSGNFTVKAEIKNAGGQIKPGMFVKCTIPKRSDVEYAYIPETALIQKNENAAMVFCVVNNLAVLRNVQIYVQKDGMVWVSSGIKKGDVVVNKPSPFLKEGSYVNY